MEIQPKGFVWKWKEIPSLKVTRRATERMLHKVVEECGDAMELSVRTGAEVAWQLAA